jgi:hypothetical protein
MRRNRAFPALLFILLLLLSSCVFWEDEVLNSLGEYTNREFYTEGDFQDYTDYAKYSYRSVDFTDNKYFKKIQPADFSVINKHLDNFEDWIETFRRSGPDRELVVHYDFDRSLIDCDDYLYIESEEHTWDSGTKALIRYDIYFFDTQSNTLFFFHNNI